MWVFRKDWNKMKEIHAAQLKLTEEELNESDLRCDELLKTNKILKGQYLSQVKINKELVEEKMEMMQTLRDSEIALTKATKLLDKVLNLAEKK